MNSTPPATSKNSVHEQDISSLFDAIPDAIMVLDTSGIVLHANVAAKKMLGGRATTGTHLGIPITPESGPADIQFLHSSGHSRWAELRCAQFSWLGCPAYAAMLRDITERIKMESQLALAGKVIDNAQEGIVVTRPDGTIISINGAFSSITGYTAEEAIGKNPRILNSGRQSPAFFLGIWNEIETLGSWKGEIINRRKDGVLYPQLLSISQIKNNHGSVTHLVGVMTDLTQNKELHQRVQYLTNFDPLTELPNRSLFEDRLRQALLVRQRQPEKPLTLVLIDIARFHVINNIYGKLIGDKVLIEVGLRLQSAIRKGDTAAHMAADQFGLLLLDGDQDTNIGQLATRVISILNQPMLVEDQQIVIEAKLGISLFGKDGFTATDLLKAADIALASAKKSASEGFRFFASDMNIRIERSQWLEIELRKALSTEQLQLHYQPQVDLSSGLICGTEALMRWQHPTEGAISPGEFIPIAEETSLIVPLGIWSLKEACRQNKAWIDAGYPKMPVAVNLSGNQFHNLDLIQVIAEALTETGLQPSLLEIELTETAFIDDIEKAVYLANQLKALGVQLAMDDFGTGYSSLAYISQFPFDKIKIDQSFIRDITTNPVNAAIAIATIAMAQSLDIKVLAEGVETVAQMQFLKSHHCRAIQGYLFSKALPAIEIGTLLAARTKLEISTRVNEQESSRPVLLVVDDEPQILSAVRRLLRRQGYKILTAECPLAALELLAQHEVQVVISDQRMQGMNGTEFLEKVKIMYPDTVRIILSGYTEVSSITGAINRGAIYRFLTKPWNDDELKDTVRNAFEFAKCNTSN